MTDLLQVSRKNILKLASTRPHFCKLLAIMFGDDLEKGRVWSTQNWRACMKSDDWGCMFDESTELKTQLFKCNSLYKKNLLFTSINQCIYFLKTRVYNGVTVTIKLLKSCSTMTWCTYVLGYKLWWWTKAYWWFLHSWAVLYDYTVRRIRGLWFQCDKV